MKKYVCLKQGCNFSTESEYQSDQHQKNGPDHDIFVIDRDYSEKIVDTDLLEDMDTK